MSEYTKNNKYMFVKHLSCCWIADWSLTDQEYAQDTEAEAETFRKFDITLIYSILLKTTCETVKYKH